MTVEYELTPEEVIETLLPLGPIKRATLFWLVYTGTILAPLSMLMPALTPLALASGSVLIGLPWVQGIQMRSRISKNLDLHCAPTCMRVTEQGLIFHRPGREMEFKWEGFRRWMQTTRMILLFPLKTQVFIVPKRALGPEQLQEFLSLVSERIGP